MELETVRIVSELVAEVAVACGSLTADDGDVLTEQRQTEFFLQVEDALGFQLADDLLPLSSHVAEGVGWIDICDHP